MIRMRTRSLLVLVAALATLLAPLAAAHEPPKVAVRELVRLQGQRRADGDAPTGRMGPLVVLWLVHTAIGAARQMYDTRVFTTIYTRIATSAAERQHELGSTPSQVAARLHMVTSRPANLSVLLPPASIPRGVRKTTLACRPVGPTDRG